MSGRKLLVALAVVAATLTCQPAALARHAPASRGKTPIDEFERMPPEQRQRALERLPPRQRQKLQERLQRFNRLPQGQQEALRNLYNRLHALPPNQQESVRTAINRFSEQAPDRQRAMRDELRSMAALPEHDREARMKSPEFRRRFSRREQGIIYEMTPMLTSR